MAESKTVDVVEDNKKEEKKKLGPKPKATAAKESTDKESVKQEKVKKAEEPKAEEPKAEEPKAEEPKAEEPKAVKEVVQVKHIKTDTITLHRPVCLYTGKSINSARRMIFGVIKVLEDDGKEFIKVQGNVRGVGKVVGYVRYAALYSKAR